jgi:CheY-like chemotaxis protein
MPGLTLSRVGRSKPDHEGADPRTDRGFPPWSLVGGSASIDAMTGRPTFARAREAQTVLVVDDHEGFRARTRRLLEQHRFRVVEAVDGAGALREAAAVRPDLVLLDVHLPDMDGFDVAAELRAAGTARAILLVSTHAEADLATRLVGSAADGFIDKADLSPATIAAGLARLP